MTSIVLKCWTEKKKHIRLYAKVDLSKKVVTAPKMGAHVD